jgi:hypothetical protein
VEGRGGYLDTSRLTPGEIGGMIAGVVLAISLFLPWFGTSDTNPNSILEGARNGESVSAWDVFPTLRWLLLAAVIAPFILSWIVARGHKLTWKPGEVTMIVGIVSFVLILCNGIILGRPEDSATNSSVEISLKIGYFVGLLAALGMALSGYIRQSRYLEGRKPPGVI